MIQPRYVAALVLASLLWCGLFFALTWTINPYGASPIRISWSRVNEFKPKRLDIDRLIKPYEVWRFQPRTVFLGTSRIHQSIDPSVLDGTQYAPAYNASIPASSLGLNISHLRQYIEFDHRLHTVVVELFLYNFLGQGVEHPPKTLAEYVSNTATLFVSTDVLRASLQTIAYNLIKHAPTYEIKPGGYYYHPPGHDAQTSFDGYPEGIWKLHESYAAGMKLHAPAFDAVREIIDLCREHDLELVFVLTPNHAYDDYYLEAIDEWKTVEEWLLRLSEENATVYSFSQPNAWGYEPVTHSMRYWYDPYHFSLEMGRAMQLALTGRKAGDTPDNFMVRMTPDKVADHIRSRREAIRRWAHDNPDFVEKFHAERQKSARARTADK